MKNTRELYSACSALNLQADSVGAIPIPGVRLIPLFLTNLKEFSMV